MPSQRQSLQRQGVPIRSRLEGPNVPRQQAAQNGGTRTTTGQSRSNVRQKRSRGPRSVREAREYGPTRIAEKGTAGVGLLEAEFFGILFLLVISLFTGSSSYGDKIMSFMKRGTLTAILFFFLALIAGIGSNAAKVAKGLGALVFVAILISTPGQDVISALDNFFKSAWVGTGESAKDSTSGQSSSDTGTAGSSSGVIGDIENAVSSGANSITEIQLPGIGPLFGAEKAISAIKGLLHL
jgi:hypothetical protein